MRVRLTFLRGTEKVAEVDGVRDLDPRTMTVHEMDSIIPVEQALERLTGLRVHIERSPTAGE